MPRVRRTAAAVCAVALVTAYAVLGGLGGPAAAATKVVFTTSSNTFDPESVAIYVGDTVSWTNNGGVNHTVTSTSDNWEKDDPIALPQQSTSHPFTKAGTYTYHCTTHTPGMSGTVVVRAKPRPSASAEPTPSPTRSTPSPSASPSPEPSASASEPSPNESSSPPASASPVPSGSTRSPKPRPSAPATGEPGPTGSPYFGEGGLTAPPPTGRERGLPVLIAVVFLVGVVTAEVRTLLATPVDEP